MTDRYRIVCILVFTLLYALVAPRTSAAQTEPVFILYLERFEGFESPYTRGLRESGNRTAQVIDGHLAVTLDRANDDVPNRTELVPYLLPVPYIVHGYRSRFNSNYWYSIRVRLNGAYLPDNDSGESLLQWIGTPDHLIASEKARNPAAALMIHRSNYVFAARADSKRVTPGYGTPRRYDRDEILELGSFLMDRGKWVCWVFNLRWSYQSTAMLKIWRDGRLFVDDDQQSLGFNDQFGPVFKFGIYKWRWQSNSTLVNSRSVDFDDLMIGVGLLDDKLLRQDGCVDARKISAADNG